VLSIHPFIPPSRATFRSIGAEALAQMRERGGKWFAYQNHALVLSPRIFAHCTRPFFAFSASARSKSK